MHKEKISSSKLSVIIGIILFALAVIQYSSFNSSLEVQNKEAIYSRLQTIHSVIAADTSVAYTSSHGHPAKFASDVTLDVSLPDSTAIVIDENGRIIASANTSDIDKNYFDRLNSVTFADTYTKTMLTEAVYLCTPTMISYTQDNVLSYAYAAPFSDSSWSLVIIVPDTALGTDLITTTDLVRRFVSSIFIFITALAAWLYFMHFFDVLRLNRNKNNLALERKRYKVAMESSNNIIWEYKVSEDKLYLDDSSIFQPTPGQAGRNRKTMLSENLIHPDDHAAFYKFCDSLISTEPTVHGELRVKDNGGDYIWYELVGTKIFDNDGYPVSIIGQATNINLQRIELDSLKEKASQDSLTKLYNYNAFIEKASHRIATMDEPTILALMLINIDDFSQLNESFGYVFSDAILIDLAGRLRKLFTSNSILGRYGADEFIVLLDHVPSISYVEDMAQYVINIFHGIYVGNRANAVTGSIGIAIYPVDDITYEGLYNKTDIALYDAKRRGKGRYSIYNEQMSQVPESAHYKKYNKQTHDYLAFEERSSVDSSIIANAIDILFDSRDIDVSINMMLSLIGIYYNLDHIFIIKFSNDKQFAGVTHEWSIDSRFSFDDRLRSEPVEADNLYTAFLQNAQGIYQCDDIAKLADPSLIRTDEYQKKHTRALFQCGIRYQEEYIGYVNVCTCERFRIWNKAEIDSLSLLSKIIGSYILHIHSEERINYVSQIDPLTGTFNFNAFINKVNEIITEHPERKYAIFYSDIYQFKLINDNYGYQVGDYILTTISSILKAVGSPEDIVCRITGDKYVSLYQYETYDELIDRVKTIVMDSKHIKQPNGDYYRLVLMIGIYPLISGDSAIVAVDRANIARKNVQDYHICNYVFYNDGMHHTLIEQKEIEDAMEEALENHEFILYYQPKIDITSKTIFGAEALVRWQRPEHGLIPPNRFIPLFEDNGFIVALDYYVLDSVCATLRRLINEGKSVYPVSVNFSRVHLSSNMLPSVLRATLEKYEIPAWLIEVEITESALGASGQYQLSILNDIHEIGCRLSMDDFGSGLSSLNVLRDLPFDILKIDKDFLHSKSTTFRERIVITNIVRMALDLNMDIICEGVETEEQELFLKRIGCFYAQGYLYAPPMPEDEFIAKYLEDGQQNDEQN